jgi:hypothetical protein
MIARLSFCVQVMPHCADMTCMTFGLMPEEVFLYIHALIDDVLTETYHIVMIRPYQPIIFRPIR